MKNHGRPSAALIPSFNRRSRERGISLRASLFTYSFMTTGEERTSHGIRHSGHWVPIFRVLPLQLKIQSEDWLNERLSSGVFENARDLIPVSPISGVMGGETEVGFSVAAIQRGTVRG